MYVCAVVQVGLHVDVAAYNASMGASALDLTMGQYLTGLGLGLAAGAVAAVACAVVLGAGVLLLLIAVIVIAVAVGLCNWLGLPPVLGVAAGLGAAVFMALRVPALRAHGLLSLRGHYFAIGTLGLGIAAGEVASGWQFIGAGSGMVTPLYPGELGGREQFFNAAAFVLAVATFFALRRLYAGRFGLAVNAIRDDEQKAEAMGLPTTRYKTVAWSVAAVFMGIAGGLVGNIVGFIDPRDVAFAGATYGVWMVLMAILGGKGTIWGPVLGAAVFHITQELFWTYLLGWQRVALGLLIVLIVVFFPQGLLGWVRARWPERFGHRVDSRAAEEAEG
ncbi:MAG: branched-chain amino acid ABC transporter permease [Rhodospirillaceae bacterium]|nr:branched-chain amino acid ABC transporter permease [Rhodospirillaceae bacterium]MBT6117897.1 branched-chain amino acid ABC transporter permease [Rhodospirillaceae bacterium]